MQQAEQFPVATCGDPAREACGISVPCRVIDLDNNATTAPAPEVIEAMARGMREAWHNPSAVHRAGQEARRAVELARQSFAELLSTRAKAITFTSGGTEAIDLALRGAIARLPEGRRVLVTTEIEHAAIREIAADLKARALAEVRTLPVDAHGVVIAEEIPRVVTGDVGIVSVQWANNETGAIQPIHAVACAAREVGALFHVDATQWIGKMPAKLIAEAPEETDTALNDPHAIACDYLTFAPHKFHGPKGVGILAAASGAAFRPQILGTQEKGRRGGTENVPGIIGAGVAASLAQAWLADPAHRLRQALLRDRFELLILVSCPGAVVNGPRSSEARLWNTTNIAFPRLEAEAILLALSEQGLCASAGAACSSGSLDPSPVLLAMGIPPELAHGSIRFSLSRNTTEAEITTAAEIVARAIARLRKSMPS